jgi:two-component system, OmpR family, response regulator
MGGKKVNKKVLIIEDDKSIAELQRDYLEINHLDTIICNDGIQWNQIFQANTFDLVILDLMLPGMSGFDILKNIRVISDIPVLLVSAKKEDVDKIRGLGLGADDYIEKPFSPNELVARVKSHISRYERIKNFSRREKKFQSIKIRGLKIDSSARRVFINDHEIVLAQKEFDLLLFMAKNPNIVFNREELFEKIWGMDALGDSATVTVHIARIREKIEADTTSPQYIETLWGAGYRFKG